MSTKAAPKISRRKWYALLGYTPRLGQALMDQAADSGKRFLALFTFPQFGKSYGVAKSVGASLLLPNIHGWIVAPTYVDGMKEFEYLYGDYRETGILAMATSKAFHPQSGNMHIEFPWGSWVRVISADNEDNLRREQLDWVILAEGSKLNANVYQRHLHARLSIRKGKLYLPTTPKGYNWCFDHFRLPSLPVKPGTFQYGPWEGTRRAIVGGESNPDYDPRYWSLVVSATPDYGDLWEQGVHDAESVALAKKTLPPQIFAEQYGGDFASYIGLVYPFDPTVHLKPRFQVPAHWPCVVGYDHGAGGGSDPTAIEVGSYGPDGTLYWWGEIYDQSTMPISSRGSTLRTLLRGIVPRHIMTGRDSKQVITELRQVGLTASCPPDWSVEARIVRMTELMGLRKWAVLEGCCPHLLREIHSYEWDEKHPGKPRDGNDHCLEAAGYASLAPVGRLPDARGVADETPEARGARFRQERLWAGWKAEQVRAEVQPRAVAYDRMLEPLVVQDYVA